MSFVDYDSVLERQKWMVKGLAQGASKSFFSGLTGTSSKAVVYQTNDLSAKEGHVITFDFDGNLAANPVEGKTQAFGKGESKRKFSDQITVQRYRFPVKNGDSFDGVAIGDLGITQHGDSRTKLSDLFVRFKDQTIFDSAQGNVGQEPSHRIDLGTSFTYNDLLAIEAAIKTGDTYSNGGSRRPPAAYKLANGEDAWLFLIDTKMALTLKQDPLYQSIMQSGDVRGEGNRLIQGVIGKIGQMYVVEAPQFYGQTFNTAIGSGPVEAGNWRFKDMSVEIQGMRLRDSADLWQGQEGFDSSGVLYSRGVVLGAGAMQIGFGKLPDYKYQESEDFAITSESALEVWMQTRKTVLTAETEDYTAAKIADLDWGVVVVDVQVQS